jgi:hypothetical protein
MNKINITQYENGDTLSCNYIITSSFNSKPDKPNLEFPIKGLWEYNSVETEL